MVCLVHKTKGNIMLTKNAFFTFSLTKGAVVVTVDI